jgi:hypothetical protein
VKELFPGSFGDDVNVIAAFMKGVHFQPGRLRN